MLNFINTWWRIVFIYLKISPTHKNIPYSLPSRSNLGGSGLFCCYKYGCHLSWQEGVTLGSEVRKQIHECWFLSRSPLFPFPSLIPAYEVVVPTFRVDLHSSIKPLSKNPEEYTKMYFLGDSWPCSAWQLTITYLSLCKPHEVKRGFPRNYTFPNLNISPWELLIFFKCKATFFSGFKGLQKKLGRYM